MGSKYVPYEVKMSSLEACEGAFEAKSLAGLRQGDPQALCHSADQAFWGGFGAHFGRLFRNRQHRNMKSVSDVFLGATCSKQLEDSKWESSEDGT